MKKILTLVAFVLLPILSHSFTAKLTLNIVPGEIKVNIQYSFEKNSVKITLPKKARLITLTSPGAGNVQAYHNAGIIMIDNVVSDYKGKIFLVYTLPLKELEFYMQDWLSIASENGYIEAGLTTPEGFQSLLIPYRAHNISSFSFYQEDLPILICGRFKSKIESDAQRTIELLFQTRLDAGIKEVKDIISTYEGLILPIEQKNITFIVLPALQGTIRFDSNSIFFITGGISPEEIKKAVVTYYFRDLLKCDNENLFAYSDLYRRLLDNSGRRQEDALYLVPIPGYSYYKEILQKGFPDSGEISCDINSMLKNFALLHLAYYTVGLDTFINSAKEYFKNTLDGTGTNLKITDFLTNAEQANLIGLYAKLLPIARWIPDLSIKAKTASRNSDSIPDIKYSFGKIVAELKWENKRSIELSNVEGTIIRLDPEHTIPQLNFYNDISLLDPKEADEIKIAYQAVLKHNIYQNETIREVLYIDKYSEPISEKYTIPKDSSVFVAVVKFSGIINGKLQMGLKELFLYVKGGKGIVFANRVRI